MHWGQGQNIPEIVSDKWNFVIKELSKLIILLSGIVDGGKKERSIILIELYSKFSSQVGETNSMNDVEMSWCISSLFN